MADLTVAKASHAAAKHAVETWHYSHRLPSGKLFVRGAWEDGKFIGVVIFSRGATSDIGKQFGLDQTQCVELTRVALTDHVSPVSQIVALAIRDLKASNPGLRLVVSFADPAQGHHGGIYQAGNWVYVGQGKSTTEFVVRGKQMHLRSVHAKGWKQTLPWLQANIDSNAYKVTTIPKHKYLMPLDRAMRRYVEKLRKPYPSAVRESDPPLRVGNQAAHH